MICFFIFYEIVIIKTVFEQILEFICLMNFDDVKYDNIPLTNDGRVALIDLECNSDNSELAVTGLTKGSCYLTSGLLNYIPYDSFDNFVSLAENKINKKNLEFLKEEISKIREKKQKNINKKSLYLNYCQSKSISLSSQLLNPNVKKIFKDEKKQKLAETVIEKINDQLCSSRNVSIKTGRTILLDINTYGFLFNKFKKNACSNQQSDSYAAIEWWQNNIDYERNKQENKIAPKIFEMLKKHGYIYSYKIQKEFNCVKIVC